MKTVYTVALALLADGGLVAVQSLQAQGTPPLYPIPQIDGPNADAYLKERSERNRTLP